MTMTTITLRAAPAKTRPDPDLAAENRRLRRDCALLRQALALCMAGVLFLLLTFWYTLAGLYRADAAMAGPAGITGAAAQTETMQARPGEGGASHA